MVGAGHGGCSCSLPSPLPSLALTFLLLLLMLLMDFVGSMWDDSVRCEWKREEELPKKKGMNL
jgi:hypothetical protein